MQKNKLTRDRSVQELTGITGISDYGVSTQFGDVVFFIVKPTNISVLPESSVTARIQGLMNVIREQDGLEFLAMNSRESFEQNKIFYRDQMEQERSADIAKLLSLDMEHLDRIQSQMASSREFCFLIRLHNEPEADIRAVLNRLEICIRDNGFIARPADAQDVMRLLNVYYEQGVSTEQYDSFDGERYGGSSVSAKTFLDMTAPSVVKFNPDHFICGNTFRSVWALREYPVSTSEQAILRHLGEKAGVTLHIYTRQVSPMEEKRILQNAANKNRMDVSARDLRQSITAESKLQDMASVISSREPLLHCAVFIELAAPDLPALKLLQAEVTTELVRGKLTVDHLLLRQQTGFLSSQPAGHNAFGTQFERVLPVSSAANLYPFNYSGKTDPHGFYIGRDKYGSNILADFDQRDEDKTSANVLILGNSGQGKSYLLKLLMLNRLEAGKAVISLDVEHEQEELCRNLGGCFVDLMAGQYRINPLELKCWDDGSEAPEDNEPEAFRQTTRLAQHISFLKDFFRCYKDFSDRHIDTIEIMLNRLYARWNITRGTDLRKLTPQDYPTLSDLYDLMQNEYESFDDTLHPLYTAETLREVLLGLHSMCKGSDAQFFNGHTNITSSRFLVFGAKGLISAAKNVRGAMLFNILSYLSDRLLTDGNTVAALDELYIWLGEPVAIEYIRNCMKRVRKKESAMMLASQNLEDFDREGVRELTKPLFAIPPHQFLFNAGSIDRRWYMDMLQLEDVEFDLIRLPQRGVCLYKCGNERYLLEVHAPEYKATLFGKAGGR